MNPIVILAVIFIVYFLYEWSKARGNRLDEDEPPWPGQPPRPPPGSRPAPPLPRPTAGPAQSTNWEEDLRRLMLPKPSAPPPLVVLPPLNRPASPQVAPPLVKRQPPPLVRRPEPAEDPDMQRGIPVQMPTLEKSSQAYQRASRLEDRVAEQLRRVHDQVTTHKQTATRKEAAPEVRQALGLLRARSSQRAAIVAAVILGPPRALAPENELG